MGKTRKAGISLIVMLITIVVIIILAASIINTVIYNNPMDNAKEAAFRSDLQEMKNAYGIRQGDLMAKYKGDKSKITEEDYAGVVHRNYTGEIQAFDVGLAYLGKDKKKQEIAESMDYIIGNPNDSVLRSWSYEIPQEDFHKDEYRTKITKIKFITSNKLPKGVVDSWDVSEGNNGSVMAWIVDDGNDGYELTIGGNGKVIANKSSGSMFRNFTAVKEIDIKALDTSNVIYMRDMFSFCSNLTSLDLNNFDLSNVTTLEQAFYGCEKIKSINMDFSTANKVTNTHGLFEDCYELENIDVSKFNTSNVIDMHYMFRRCGSLKSLDLSKFNTSKAINMTGIFEVCSGLTSLNLSSFNTINVTNMDRMFNGCSSLISLDLGNHFDTTSVISMSSMFSGCNKLKTNITIKNVETSSYMGMFSSAATEKGAEIIVNYTSETSDLVDKMLETKSEKSNVVKGDLVS